MDDRCLVCVLDFLLVIALIVIPFIYKHISICDEPVVYLEKAYKTKCLWKIAVNSRTYLNITWGETIGGI